MDAHNPPCQGCRMEKPGRQVRQETCFSLVRLSGFLELRAILSEEGQG